MSVTLGRLLDLVRRRLERSGASPVAAASVARSVVAAEADEMRSIGLGYLPIYCRQLEVGKVRGDAVPTRLPGRSGAVRIDADHGFAHPAIEFGQAGLADAARANGIAAMTVTRSYSPGILGHVIEPTAEAGLLVLILSNSPPNVAPWGGRRKLFGTNPLALAVPRAGETPLIIDMATSAVTKVALVERARSGEPLPSGWAHDADGNPTTDGAAALAGSLAPLGGAKGAGLGLIVEILAAGLGGANWSKDATLYGDDRGGPPGVGQLLIAIDPDAFAAGFLARIEDLCGAIQDVPGARLPGDRRLAARRRAQVEGVVIDAPILAWLESG